ncbi:MAG: hypothetical protein WCD76_15175 [Pyrinomonadaceae bacterium]
MKIQRMAGWLLIVFASAQVFQALSLTATTKNSPGLAFVLLASTMFTGGAVLLWRGGGALQKTQKT